MAQDKIINRLRREEKDRLHSMNDYNRDLSKFARNLNLEYLKGNLTPIYNREEILITAQKILLRKGKANILLIGSAGCGKTAIAEGLASLLVEQQIAYNKAVAEAEAEKEAEGLERRRNVEKPLFLDCVIYDLSMNALVGGAKYRGDFEERLQKIVDLASQDKRIILFVDEVHQINTIGQAEGATSMGQILKPALARGEIRVIGATTTEESEIIKKDKALARRFSEVFVPQLVGDSAVQCLESIMNDYSKFHKVGFNKTVTALEIYSKTCEALPRSVFPNNVIDIVDEVLASAKFEGKKSVDITDIEKVIGRMIRR